MEAGEGSSPRPFSVSQHEYNNRWDAIFQRDLDVCSTPPSECWSVKCQIRNTCKNSDIVSAEEQK